jgi:hypothetical protein
VESKSARRPLEHREAARPLSPLAVRHLQPAAEEERERAESESDGCCCTALPDAQEQQMDEVEIKNKNKPERVPVLKY